MLFKEFFSRLSGSDYERHLLIHSLCIKKFAESIHPVMIL